MERRAQKRAYQNDQPQDSHVFQRIRHDDRPDDVARDQELEAEYDRAPQLPAVCAVGDTLGLLPDIAHKGEGGDTASGDDHEYAYRFNSIPGNRDDLGEFHDCSVSVSL